MKKRPMSNWIMLSKSSLAQMKSKGMPVCLPPTCRFTKQLRSDVSWILDGILFCFQFFTNRFANSSSSESLFPQERCELYRHGWDVSSAQLWPKVVPRRGCDAKDVATSGSSRFIEAALKSILDHGLRRTPAYVPRCPGFKTLNK